MKNGDKRVYPISDNENYKSLGLTKREMFAAMAMQGILSGRNESVEQRNYPVDQVAIWAIQQAEELLKQLES